MAWHILPTRTPYGYAYSFQITACFWGVILLKPPNPGEQTLEAGPKSCSISDDIGRESPTDASKQLLIPAHGSSDPTCFTSSKSWAHRFSQHKPVQLSSPLLLWPDYVTGDSLCAVLVQFSSVKPSQKLRTIEVIYDNSKSFVVIENPIQRAAPEVQTFWDCLCWGLLWWFWGLSAGYGSYSAWCAWHPEKLLQGFPALFCTIRWEMMRLLFTSL